MTLVNLSPDKASLFTLHTTLLCFFPLSAFQHAHPLHCAHIRTVNKSIHKACGTSGNWVKSGFLSIVKKGIPRASQMGEICPVRRHCYARGREQAGGSWTETPARNQQWSGGKKGSDGKSQNWGSNIVLWQCFLRWPLGTFPPPSFQLFTPLHLPRFSFFSDLIYSLF